MPSLELEQELKVLTYASTYDAPLQNHVIRLAEKILCNRNLRKRYVHFKQMLADGHHVNQAAIESLGISVKVNRGSMDSVPKTGPVLIVCNHPYGIVDGLAVASLVRAHRQDLKILAHQGISQLPQMSGYFLPIVFDLSREAKRINVSSVKQFKDNLRSGGCGIVFPAGAVSTRSPLWTESVDPDWQDGAAKWARLTGAQVVPIFVEGDCSMLFHFVSQFSLTLRLSKLLHENCKKIDSSVSLRIGSAIDCTQLDQDAPLANWTALFRERTYALSEL